MTTVKGTSATGKAARIIQIRKCGDKLMLSIAKDGDLFNRQGAVVVAPAELLKKIAAATGTKR